MPRPFAAVLDPLTAAGSPFVGLGYPTLTIKATDAGFLAPAALAAGRYLVTLNNAGGRNVEAQFVLPPAGVAADEVVAILAGAVVLPRWFYLAVWNGGPADASVATFAMAQAVVDLTPGIWLIAPSDGDRTIMPVTLTVTGKAGALMPPPAVDVTITMHERGFDVSDEVVAGPQVWEVTNAGDVPHEIVLLSYPRPVTMHQVMAVLVSRGGSPSSDARIDPDLLTYAGYVPLISPGVTTWVALDLAPGSYVALSGISRADSTAEVGLGKAFTVTRGRY